MNRSTLLRGLITGLFFIIFTMPAGASSTDIVGVWNSPKGQLQIYQKGQKFVGKVLSFKDMPQKRDVNNPNPRLRKRSLVGSELLTALRYDNGRWIDGRFYNPKDGKLYACQARLKDANTLELRVYIGVSVLGRSLIWKRQ